MIDAMMKLFGVAVLFDITTIVVLGVVVRRKIAKRKSRDV